MTVRAGFIGLGSQGAPMARRILQAGYVTALWARREATLEPFAGSGATFAPTPAALGAASDVVGICVWDDPAVEEVVLGPEGVLTGMQEGSVLAVHSTVAPETCRRLATLAAERGVAVVDAPVSGGAPAAEAGRLLVMVGGEADAVARCRPVFETYGDPVVHVGPIGSGQLTKLVNNALLAAHIGLAEAALELGAAFGLDPDALGHALRHGSASSLGLNYLLGVRAASGAFGQAGGRTSEWASKDVALAAEEARRVQAADDHPLLVLGRRGAAAIDPSASHRG